MDINDPNMIDEELPSVKNFMQNESNLPSISDFISTNGEDDLPSCNEFVEVKEEVIVEEETHEPVDSQNDSTKVIVSLIESLRNSIPEVKSYDKELYELMNRIEEVRRDIPDVPEVKDYDEQISELQESIHEVRRDIPEVKDYDEQISELQESIHEVKNKNFPDFKWIANTFTTIEEDYDKLNSLLARYKGNFDLEISNIVESIDISKFENDTNYKKVNEEFVTKIDETKKIIDARLKETSKNITSIKKEYKNSDKEIREEIKKEYLRLNEDVSKSLKNLKHSDNSLNDKIDQVNSCFETLKSELENLPEVKYYDEEIKDVNDSVSTIKSLVKILENKLNKKTSIIDNLNEKISNIEESILVSNEPEEIKEDPLTPLDQNFVTLNDLSNHYRLFINRIQQQLASLGGGGETRLEFLDDVDRDTAKVNGKFLKYDSSVGKWVGANASGGAGSQTLDETLGLGNTSSLGMSVGVATVTKLHVDPVGSGFTYSEDLVVQGNARVTGILSIGTSSIVLDPNAKTISGLEELKVGSTTIKNDTTGNITFVSNVNPTQTINVGIGTTVSVNTTGIITASSFVGDGSGLTGIVASGSGVVVQNGGSDVGTASTINFGSDLDATFSGGTATINVSIPLSAVTDVNTSNLTGISTDYLMVYDPSVPGFKFVNPKTYFGINNDANPAPDIVDYGTY